MGVSPPRVELQALPSSQLTQEVLVDNPSQTAPLAVTVELNDALFQSDGSVLYLPPASHPNSLANWLAVNPLQFVLPATATETIRYTVEVPPGTPDGTYWSVMFFESGPVEERQVEGGIGIRSRVRVGHIVYVDVGQVTRQGEITGIRYGENEGGELRIAFNNTGNGLARVQGRVEVRSETGELVQALEVPDNAFFPGYTREVAVPLAEPLEPGNYIALAVLDYGGASVAAGEGSVQVP